jgi:hypothetical protein
MKGLSECGINPALFNIVVFGRHVGQCDARVKGLRWESTYW